MMGSSAVCHAPEGNRLGAALPARFGTAPVARYSMQKFGSSEAVLLCSFQKEESVLIDELLNLDQGTGRSVRIATIDTGVLFAETLQTWRVFEERFGVKIEVFDAYSPDGPWTNIGASAQAQIWTIDTKTDKLGYFSAGYPSNSVSTGGGGGSSGNSSGAGGSSGHSSAGGGSSGPGIGRRP